MYGGVASKGPQGGRAAPSAGRARVGALRKPPFIYNIYIYIYIYIHMGKLLGWLETRPAQNTLNYINMG